MTGPQLLAIDDLIDEFPGEGSHVFYLGPITREAIKDLRREWEELRDALESMIDTEPCWLDHNGHCQEHLDFGDGECYMARAKAILKVRL